MSILIVVAHPDDETLGAGASTAKWSDAGTDVFWLVLGEGSSSRSGNTESDRRHQIDACREAAHDLGAHPPVFGGLADSRFDTIALVDLAGRITDAIRDIDPVRIVTHDRSDLNQDHRRVFEAAMIATRPAPNQRVTEVWSMEVASATEWGFGQFGEFSPNCFVDVGDTIAKKRAALGRYMGEMREFPHPRSWEVIEARALLRGSSVGVGAAEAFRILRRTE